MIEALPVGYAIVRDDRLWHAKKGKKSLRRANRQPFGHTDYNVVLKYARKHAELELRYDQEVPDWKV